MTLYRKGPGYDRVANFKALDTLEYQCPEQYELLMLILEYRRFPLTYGNIRARLHDVSRRVVSIADSRLSVRMFVQFDMLLDKLVADKWLTRHSF
jgi:aromatic ring-opening dioxygenase LigB subunit